MTVALSKLNFRDVGGLPAGVGKRVRPGVLYRSEGPANFTNEHRRELGELGIKLIGDLRAEAERRVVPNDWSATARLFNLEVTLDLHKTSNEGWSELRHNPSEANARRTMKANYAAMPAVLHPFMPGLIDAILGEEIPALLHCTAGKDRTGVLVALLLTLLGVPHEAVVADYIRSDVFAKNLRLGGSMADVFKRTFGFVPSETTMNAMIGVDPEFLEVAFDVVALEWGSIDAYFESAGVAREKIERLRDALLVDDLRLSTD